MNAFAHILAATGEDPLIAWLTQGGPVGILALIVVAFLRGWIVSGAEHKRVCDERDRSLELVYRNAGLASRAVDATLSRLEAESELFTLAQKTSAPEHRSSPERH